MKKILDGVTAVLSSNALAVVLLLLLLLLTFLGTIEQVDRGIYEVQKKYFESVVFVEWFFDVVPVPLPGGYLLLVLLGVNLLLGGVFRVRFTPAKIGIFIAHLGVVFLLVAAFLTYRLSDRGFLTVHEGETVAEYSAEYGFEIAVRPGAAGGEVRELLIPEMLFREATAEEPRVFVSDELPFSLEVLAWVGHCRPWPAQTARRPATGAVEGFVLEKLPEEKEAEAELRGAQVAVVDRKTGRRSEALLWCGTPDLPAGPFIVEAEGRRFALSIRKELRNLPFALRGESSGTEYHPRTRMPSAFTTEVTKIDGDARQRVRIVMNEPLRHLGYTLYNSQVARDGRGDFSVLAVVRNPADQLPLYATLVITLGLLIQFVRRLTKYIGGLAGRQA
jgi:hypothetical protein